MLFVCPKCREKLNISAGGAARCNAGHSYDRSREGYYNLLLSNTGGTHGDNAEMIAARAKFLSEGYYEPLAKALCRLALQYAASAEVMLDAGCGEGYYTELIAEGYEKKRAEDMKSSDSLPAVYAFDISRAAVKRAAKRCKEARLAVASSYNMPIDDGAVDLLVNTFSPMATEESLRVLRRGGVFLMAIPAEEHLFELKKEIYDKPYKNEVANTDIPGFSLIHTEELRFEISLDSQSAVESLFKMTPYAYRTSLRGIEKMLSLDSLKCTAHFITLVYKKL